MGEYQKEKKGGLGAMVDHANFGNRIANQGDGLQGPGGTSPQSAYADMAQQPPIMPDGGAADVREDVVAVRKNGDGDIVELKLSSGRVVDYLAAQQLAKQGVIRHVNVFRGRDGDEHLRSDADGDPSNNLDNLPSF